MSIEQDVSAIKDRLLSVQGTLQQLTDDQFYANLDIQSLNAKALTQVIDANNTTSSALDAGATYTGDATDITGYSQVNIEIFARPGVVAGDGSSAKASFFFQFSKDGVNWDVNVPALVRDPSLVIPIPIINVHKFFRVVYINDGGVAAIAALGLLDLAGTPTLQTVFRLTTYLFPLATKELTRTMDQGISGSDPASLVRAGVMGRNPTLNYVNKTASGLSLNQNSTTLLGPGATFTGSTFEDITGYSSICVNIDSNLTGVFILEFSSDGINVSASVSRTFVNVNAGQSYTFTPTARYVRIKYTNTAGTQAFFRLQTIFKTESIGPILAPLNTPLNPISLGQTVVSVPSDGIKTTYSASALNIASVAAATDIFTISGSNSKTVKVLKVVFSGTRTNATQTDVLLLKRSTANTGGASLASTIVPHDSFNIASLANVLSYTANPTVLGTLVGNIRTKKIFIPATGTSSEGGVLEYNFGSLGQTIVLRGASETLCVNFNGATMVGSSFNFSVEWTEE